MKRILVLLLCAAMLISSPAFAEEKNWYLETAKEMTTAMGELSKDEAYLSMYTSQVFDCIDAFAENDFSEFSAAWQFDLPPQKGMRAVIGMMAGQDIQMGDLGWNLTYQKLPLMIASQHNANLGTETIAASTILTYSCTYAMPEGFSPCAIALALQNAISYVSFSQTGEDTITVTAQPLFCPEGEAPEKIIPTLGIMFAPSRTQLF